MRVPTDPTVSAIRREIQPGVWLDSRLALWLESPRVLVIADLHWGYAAAHRARGNLLPTWGDDDIEARLRALVQDYAPAEMLWLGDVVHAAEGASRAESFLRDAPVRTAVLAGNHDRRWRGAADTAAQRGPFFFHHGDAIRTIPAGCVEVIGHHHPAVAWSDGAGGNVKLPALLADPERLVLPAFSPWAAGTDCTATSTPLSVIWAIAPRRIFAVTPSNRIAV
jgi:metallophosphoesterase superfamily enzyme